jgi:hypothetical protein
MEFLIEGLSSAMLSTKETCTLTRDLVPSAKRTHQLTQGSVKKCGKPLKLSRETDSMAKPGFY